METLQRDADAGHPPVAIEPSADAHAGAVRPGIVVIAQGRKRGYLGSKVYIYIQAAVWWHAFGRIATNETAFCSPGGGSGVLAICFVALIRRLDGFDYRLLV